MAAAADAPPVLSAPAPRRGPSIHIVARVCFTGVLSEIERRSGDHRLSAETMAGLRTDHKVRVALAPGRREAGRIAAEVSAAHPIKDLLTQVRATGVSVRCNVICAGAVYSSGRSVPVENGDSVHCVMQPRLEGQTNGAAGASAPAPVAPRGFDRLSEMGFSAEDISGMRDQFAASHTVVAVDQLLALEDEWLDAEGWGLGASASRGAEQPVGDPSGEDGGRRQGFTYTQGGSVSGVTVLVDDHRQFSNGLRMKDLVTGVTIGFFLGALSLLVLFFKGAQVSRRGHQLGITGGVVLNFLTVFLIRMLTPGERDMVA